MQMGVIFIYTEGSWCYLDPGKVASSRLFNQTRMQGADVLSKHSLLLRLPLFSFGIACVCVWLMGVCRDALLARSVLKNNSEDGWLGLCAGEVTVEPHLQVFFMTL